MTVERNGPRRQRENTKAATVHVDAVNSPACTLDIDHLSVYTVTVNERGQVVLPAELRHQCNLQAHDTLLIFGYPVGTSTMALLRFKDIGDYQQCLSEVQPDESGKGR